MMYKESHMTDQEKIAYLEQALREKDHELMRARQEFPARLPPIIWGDASLRHRIELAEQELGFMRNNSPTRMPKSTGSPR